MGRSTVSKIIEEVCEAIWKNIQPIIMPEPNEEIWRASENVFRERWNFPHCVGSLDGKHVRIKAPRLRGSEYFNYKKYHSIVLLALVDGNKRFLAVDVGQYGRVSDGSVFTNSAIGKRLTEGSIGLPPDENLGGVSLPYVIVGDEAFPLKRYLMRPFPRTGRRLSEAERIYNYRLSRSRNTVENAFGILSNTWRVYHHPLECRLELADKIVKATVVLHNYLRASLLTQASVPANEEDEEEVGEVVQNLVQMRAGTARNATREALGARTSFMEYFMSNEGRVEWQERVVNRIV